jgi:hypothetical protein
MQNLNIPASNSTPEISFDHQKGILSMTGRSTTENPLEIFDSIDKWMSEYLTTPRPHTIVEINLEYFNTATSKCLIDFFSNLKKLIEGGNTVMVKWKYDQEDEDMEDAGNEFSQFMQIPFELIPLG